MFAATLRQVVSLRIEPATAEVERRRPLTTAPPKHTASEIGCPFNLAKLSQMHIINLVHHASNCYKNLSTPTSVELSYLWSFGSSTINTTCANFAGSSKLLGNTLDLLGQFSCWTKNKHYGTITMLQQWLVINMHNTRYDELQKHD